MKDQTERRFLLPMASQEVIEELLTTSGADTRLLDIAALPDGALIRVKTRPGSCFLLEVTDPVACTAHVFRRDERLLTSRVGYLGEQKITPRLQIGQIMFLGELFTSRVTEIEVVRSEGH